MSSSEEENDDVEILDLRNMEDVFTCLEAVAMAQAMLSSVDPVAADELEKVTQALGALSLVIDQGDLVQVVEKTVEVEVPVEGAPAQAAPPSAPPPAGKKGIDDLVEFASGDQPQEAYKPPSDEDDGIVDILTGEKIR